MPTRRDFLNIVLELRDAMEERTAFVIQSFIQGVNPNP
jgi:hypothetical protein